LTFDEAAGQTGTHQQYQGVYFKWGSLVGFSPTASSRYTGLDHVIFVPAYNSGSNPSWSVQTISYFGRFDDVPWIDQDPDPSDCSMNVNYLASPACNNDLMYNSMKGDICRYLGKTGAAPKGYRMPTMNEFSVLVYTSWDPTHPESKPVAGGWTYTDGGAPVEWNNRLPDGKSIVPRYAAFNGVRFPYSGVLARSGFDIRPLEGAHWSGSAEASPSPGSSGFRWEVSFNTIGITGMATDYAAMPVRCIKD
jgi:hypothetical protein